MGNALRKEIARLEKRIVEIKEFSPVADDGTLFEVRKNSSGDGFYARVKDAKTKRTLETFGTIGKSEVEKIKEAFENRNIIFHAKAAIKRLEEVLNTRYYRELDS